MGARTQNSCAKIVIGIGGLAVSADPKATLITHSLGSCIGVTVWDPVLGIGGMIHCLLPRQGSAAEDAPARFVDSGVVALLETVYGLGATRERLIVKAAGAGSPLESCSGYRIGERNYATLRKILWKNSLLLEAECIGGAHPRTLSLSLRDGITLVRSGATEKEL